MPIQEVGQHHESGEAGTEREPPAHSGGPGLRRMVRDSLLYSIGDAFLKLLAFILVPLYTRALTPDEYGTLGFAVAFAQVVSPIVTLGVASVFPVVYYRYEGEERRRLLGSLLSFAIVYGFVVALLISLAGSALVGLLTYEVAFHPYVAIAVWTMFLSTLSYFPLAALNVREQVRTYVLYSIGSSLIGVATTLLLVVILDLGVLGALWAGLATSVVGLLVGLWLVRRYYAIAFERAKLASALRLSIPALPHLFTGTVWRVADRFFLTAITAMATTGVYTFAATVASMVVVVLGGVSMALSPQFYRRANERDPQLRLEWARIGSLFILVAAFTTLALALGAPYAVAVLAPISYQGAAAVLPVLALGSALIGTTWLLGPGIAHTGRTWVYPVASLPAVGVSILLNLYLVPPYGASGAAWALVGAAIVQLAIMFYFSQRFYVVPYEYSNIAKILVVASLIFWTFHDLSGDSVWVTAGLKSLGLLTLPAVLFALSFFSSGEVSALHEFTRRLRWWRSQPPDLPA